MTRLIRQTVQVQEGGRIEITSSELHPGQIADVVVSVEDKTLSPTSIVGLFADEPELLDEIMKDVYADRQRPLRLSGE